MHMMMNNKASTRSEARRNNYHIIHMSHIAGSGRRGFALGCGRPK